MFLLSILQNILLINMRWHGMLARSVLFACKNISWEFSSILVSETLRCLLPDRQVQIWTAGFIVLHFILVSISRWLIRVFRLSLILCPGNSTFCSHLLLPLSKSIWKCLDSLIRLLWGIQSTLINLTYISTIFNCIFY